MNRYQFSGSHSTSSSRGPRAGTLVLRVARTCALAATLASVAGCWAPRVRSLPPETLATSGTATFDAPRDRVFEASIAALRANGYSIEREDSAAGIAFTTTLPARSFPVAREGDIVLRRYEIHVAQGVGQSVHVVASPLLFDAHRERGEIRNARARGPETAWTVNEELAEWKRLFAAIRRHLERAENEHPHASALAERVP